MKTYNSMQELLDDLFNPNSDLHRQHGHQTIDTRIDARIDASGNIHSDLDRELLDALRGTLKNVAELARMSNATVLTTIAYLLAHEIYGATKNEASACEAASRYTDYSHLVVHNLWMQFGRPNEEGPLNDVTTWLAAPRRKS